MLHNYKYNIHKTFLSKVRYKIIFEGKENQCDVKDILVYNNVQLPT